MSLDFKGHWRSQIVTFIFKTFWPYKSIKLCIYGQFLSLFFIRNTLGRKDKGISYNWYLIAIKIFLVMVYITIENNVWFDLNKAFDSLIVSLPKLNFWSPRKFFVCFDLNLWCDIFFLRCALLIKLFLAKNLDFEKMWWKDKILIKILYQFSW